MARTGGQPQQYRKIVHSKPMDLTRVQETVNPVNEEMHGSIKPNTIKGGKIVTEQNMKGPIIDSLDK